MRKTAYPAKRRPRKDGGVANGAKGRDFNHQLRGNKCQQEQFLALALSLLPSSYPFFSPCVVPTTTHLLETALSLVPTLILHPFLARRSDRPAPPHPTYLVASIITVSNRFTSPTKPCVPSFKFPPHPLPAFKMVYTITVHLTAKSDPDCIEKLKSKLIEASRVYSQDKETLSWFVMQSVFDKREFTIVERYERESSQQFHLNNPYWKTFDPYVLPLLEKPMDLRRFEELDTSQDVGIE